MIPVKQTKFGINEGNCFTACVASILHLDLEIIPNFCVEHGSYFQKFTNEWLREKTGFFYMESRIPDEETRQLILKGYYIVSGKSPRSKLCDHCVVGFNGQMVHDPHPDNTFISGDIRYYGYGFFIPYDPMDFKLIK